MRAELEQLRAELDHHVTARALQDRQERQVEQKLQDTERQLKAQVQGVQELEAARRRLHQENQGLAQGLEEHRAQLNEALQLR